MRIVVIGGRGFLGSRAVSALRAQPGVEVIVAGRTASGAGSAVVDLARPETFAAVDGADVVVDVSNSHTTRPDALAAHVLAKGGVFLSCTSDTEIVDRLLAAHRGAPERGALVIGAGIFTGVSNALARAAFEAQPGCDEIVIGVRTSPLSGAGGGTVDLMIDALVRPAVRFEADARVVESGIGRGPVIPFVEGDYATLHVPFPEPVMVHASTKVPNVAMYMAPAPGLLRLSFLAMPAALLRVRPFLALLRVYFTVLRRALLRWLGTRVGLVARARRRSDGAEKTLALSVDDGMALGGAAIAATALVLAEKRAGLAGTYLVDEVVPLDVMLARSRALMPALAIETRGFGGAS
jgi:hypothetical protein